MAAPFPDSAALERAWNSVRECFAPSPLRQVGDVWYKWEFALPTGSFKVRGAVAAISERAREAGPDASIVAASAGNHGLGVAWAARRHGVRATVVVPAATPEVKRRKLAGTVEMIVCDRGGYDEAEGMARSLAASRGVPFLSPFDDTMVMAGNGGTVAREILAELPETGTVVTPVGGGGLLAGILSELIRCRRDSVRVVAVQSEASPAFAASLRDGSVYRTWPAARTLAEGLEGGTGETAVTLARRMGVESRIVSERSIARAMRDLLQKWGTPVEGSGAVVEAARLGGMLNGLPEPMVMVVTGGNVDPAVVRAG